MDPRDREELEAALRGPYKPRKRGVSALLLRLRNFLWRLWRRPRAGVLHASETVLPPPKITLERLGRAQKYKPPKNPNIPPDPHLGLKKWVYPQQEVRLQEVKTGKLVPGSVSKDGNTMYVHTASGWQKANKGEKMSKKERRKHREQEREELRRQAAASSAAPEVSTNKEGDNAQAGTES